MNYKIDYITNKPKLTNRNMNAEYITIHSTANPKSTAQNERDYLNSASNTSSTGFHIAVDEKGSIECIPLNKVAYHAGTSVGNNTSIGIEICESGNREKTIQNTVELVVKMLHERNWGVDKLKRHFDWSGKNCPNIMSKNNWADWHKFKLDIQKGLDKLTKQDEHVVQTVSNWAKDAWKWGVDFGITDGSRPQNTATREEIITMLYRLSKV